MTRDELITKIFQAGAAYWKEPGAEKVTYLFSIDELEKLVRMVQPKPVTDELIAEAWHESAGHVHRFAKLLQGKVNACS